MKEYTLWKLKILMGTCLVKYEENRVVCLYTSLFCKYSEDHLKSLLVQMRSHIHVVLTTGRLHKSIDPQPIIFDGNGLASLPFERPLLPVYGLKSHSVFIHSEDSQ